MSDEKPSDPDQGIHAGRRIARRFLSPDGMIVLVGKSASDNDLLSLELGEPADFWFHVSGESGSHVVVRNPDRLDRLPRETLLFAAGLAAGYSKARNARRVSVHMCRCGDVSKPRNFEPGKVLLRRWESVIAAPRRGDDGTPA